MGIGGGIYYNNGTSWIALTGDSVGGTGDGTVMGDGTAGTAPRWATSSVLEDSIITDDGSTVTVAGDISAGDNDITNVGDIALDTISADDGSSFIISNDWTNLGNTVTDLGSVTTADINGGTIDGVVINDSTIGLTTAAAGAFTNLTASTAYLASGTTINEFSTDGTLGGDSDAAVPTEHAVKTYVDGSVGDGINGSGADTQVTYWTNESTIAGDAGMTYAAADDLLTVVNATFTAMTTDYIDAFSLVGKLTGGVSEIEGSNFDINGGSIDGTAIGRVLADAEFNALTADSINLNAGATIVEFSTDTTLAGGDDEVPTELAVKEYVDEAVAGVDGVAGSDTYVQFNDGGNFGGDSAFTWKPPPTS